MIDNLLHGGVIVQEMNEPIKIPLSKGQFALISPEDYEMVSRYKWHVTSHGYAARSIGFGNCVYLHREINKTPDGMQTDHIDRNRLNCVRANLRTCSPSQNLANRIKPAGEFSSQFKGATRILGKGVNIEKSIRWSSTIKVCGKFISLGNFKTELDAAFAYNIAAQKHYGEFALLNVLPMDYLATHSEPEFFHCGKYSKVPGVSLHKQSGRWRSYMTVAGKLVHSALHDTEAEAIAKRKEVEQIHLAPKPELTQS